LNKPITFMHSSLRFFSENEHHVTRFCEDDVLLMVFEGVLRFTEGDVFYEIYPGEYHIQKNHTFQTGEEASDSPKYLYVHFLAPSSFSYHLLYRNTYIAVKYTKRTFF